MIVLRGYLFHRRRDRALAEVGMPLVPGGPEHWLRLAVLDEIESVWYLALNGFDRVPMPAAWDVAVSAWVLRRRLRRWGDRWFHPRYDLPVPGCCTPCRERWRAGRNIQHLRCARAVGSAVERAVDELDRKLHHPVEPPRRTW